MYHNTPGIPVLHHLLEFTLIQGGFRKGRGTRDQIANICWIIEKEREFQKNTTASFPMLKPLTVWITINYGKFLKGWEYQIILPVSWETCMWTKKQQLEPDMERLTGSKLGKEYDKAVNCHPAYLTYMQTASCKMLVWMNHRLEPRLPGEITTSEMQMTPLQRQKSNRN